MQVCTAKAGRDKFFNKTCVNQLVKRCAETTFHQADNWKFVLNLGILKLENLTSYSIPTLTTSSHDQAARTNENFFMHLQLCKLKQPDDCMLNKYFQKLCVNAPEHYAETTTLSRMLTFSAKRHVCQPTKSHAHKYQRAAVLQISSSNMKKLLCTFLSFCVRTCACCVAMLQRKKGLQEVLPKAGLVYSEKGTLTEVLSKPKIMPIKSISLQKLEEMEKRATEVAATKKNETAAAAGQAPCGNETVSSSSQQQQHDDENDDDMTPGEHDQLSLE